MDKIASLSPDDRRDLFSATETKSGIPAALVEKDFWVCWTLRELFTTDALKSKILFKGGTTLSKIFGIIKRFSEDIDLILDWSQFTDEPPHRDRSNTQQSKFNSKINAAAQAYLEESFVPILKTRLAPFCEATIDSQEELTIRINYPASFEETYVRPEILLETGPLAAWEPHGSYVITPYAADFLPGKFQSAKVRVSAIKAERTFWEKVTILHVEAHRNETKAAKDRYSRHYYDMMMLAKSSIKQSAFRDLSLLEKVVEFKKKFYYQKWARYDLAVPKTLKLYPPKHVLKSLTKDYEDMQIMIFGDTPTFDEILESVLQLQREINQL